MEGLGQNQEGSRPEMTCDDLPIKHGPFEFRPCRGCLDGRTQADDVNRGCRLVRRSRARNEPETSTETSQSRFFD